MSRVKNAYSDKGIALLTVLWILTIIMVIVFSFSFATRTDVLSTMAFKDGIERRFISEAGIERGIMEILYRKKHMAEEDIWKTDGTVYQDIIGDGYYRVRILDESGKVNINTASDIILRNLFLNIGISNKEVDAIVDCIMDWKDKDDFYRLNGAESSYYRSLPNPYEAKNAKFDTMEELLMVKGISPEILYGSGEKKGIIDFITVYSQTNTINVNAAPKEVLLAIPGMTEKIADSIISYRKQKEIRNLGEIQAILGENYQLMAPYISAGESNIFTIDSAGFKDKIKGGFGTRATVFIIGGNKIKFVYFKSPVNLQGLEAQKKEEEQV